MNEKVERILRLARRGLSRLGRAVEFALTGEAHYFFATCELADIEIVDSRVKANRILGEVRQLLSDEFGLVVSRPLIVDIHSLAGADLRTTLYHLGGAMGRYRSHSFGEERAHLVTIVEGLSAERFRAVLAHEFVHAWLREKNLLGDNRCLREGLARWVEYKVLLRSGERREARKLKGIRLWAHGRGVRKLIELEERVGEGQVLAHLVSHAGRVS